MLSAMGAQILRPTGPSCPSVHPCRLRMRFIPRERNLLINWEKYHNPFQEAH